MKQKDKIKEVKTYHYGNVIATVTRPDLTPEERERRMEKIKVAAANLIMASLKAKEKHT